MNELPEILVLLQNRINAHYNPVGLSLLVKKTGAYTAEIYYNGEYAMAVSGRPNVIWDKVWEYCDIWESGYKAGRGV